MINLHPDFPRYTRRDPAVPVHCLTPGRGGCIVRFFDTTAISPSGRYAACTRLPFEDRLPEPGETAEVVLIDLQKGPSAERVVATSAGWEPQLGAQVQWGANDETLFFSDVDTSSWTPHSVRLNPQTGERQRLDGPLYHASPDGRTLVGTNPRLMAKTQTGYGVVLPPDGQETRTGTPDDDGIWLTDVESKRSRLLISLREIGERFGDALGLEGGADDWKVYAFHSKFAPSGDRLLFTTRSIRADYDGEREPIQNPVGSGLRFGIFTCRPDGSELSLAVPWQAWKHGGHHINFSADGNTLTMNLGGMGNPDNPRELRFVQVSATGGELTTMLPEMIGSGHPSLHRDGRHLVTDCYWHERWKDEADGTTPLRWVDLKTGEEKHICRVGNRPPSTASGTLRVDPHPAWDRTWNYITFTGVAGGTRRLYIADMRSLL